MELIVDSFAGGGGASEGIERALGRSPDIAINHDPEALAMHAMNHRNTRHLPHNIWKVDPHAVCDGRPVGLLWASPDCKHFSKAKGGKPVSKNVRDLAWVVVRWGKQVRPRVMILENVEEFQTWGPLGADGMPCPDRKGQTFKRWVGELRKLGYKVEWRELSACDYGAPTIRKRLFVIARCDRQPIVWPKPTHGAPGDTAVILGEKKPWRTAADIIDWSIPCPSIFLTREKAKAQGLDVRRPLADATLARIAKGIQRYVIDAEEPFIVPCGDGIASPFVTKFNTGATGHDARDPLHTITSAHSATHPGGACPLGIAVPYMIPRYGERVGQEPRTRDVLDPYPTNVTTGNEASLVTAFLAQHNLGMVGHDAREPVSTLTGKGSHQMVVSAGLLNLKGSDRRGRAIGMPAPALCAGGGHQAEVRAFLVKYYGTDQDPRLEEPLHTVTTKDRFGIVMVHGLPYQIVDIGMRMLTPRERYRAQGFGDDYIIDQGIMVDGSNRHIAITKTGQGRMCGNSVCPDVAEALAAANYQPDSITVPRRRRRPATAPLFDIAAEGAMP